MFGSILKWAKAYEAGAQAVTDAHYDGYVKNLSLYAEWHPDIYAGYLTEYPEFADGSWQYTGSFYN
jgi:hypothetical protein